MLKINWILQKNLIKAEIVNTIKQTLQESHIPFEEVEIIPFSDELPQIKNEDAFNIFYGSTTLIFNALKIKKFRKGIFYNAATFNIKNYVEKWGERMLNAESIFTTFEEFALKYYDDSKELFIRPIEDDKAFSGTVMKFEEIKNFATNLQDSNNPYLTLTTKICISDPKSIQKEWRSFIVNKKVVSATRYITHEELNISVSDVPDRLIQFIEESCEIYNLHPIFVMDIALCDDKYYIIECNCFNGTGFYQHDIKKIIYEINEYLLKLNESDLAIFDS